MEVYVLLRIAIFIQKNYKVYFDFDVSFTVEFCSLNSYVLLIARFLYCSEKFCNTAGKISFLRIFLRIESQLY